MWAPRGQTPVLKAPLSWKKMSVSAALAYRWDGQKARLMFRTTVGAYNGTKLVGFLRALKREFKGRRVILVWDRLPAHRMGAVARWLPGQSAWLSATHLPAYCPELNPAEGVFGNYQGQELAGLCVTDIREKARHLRRGMRRIRNRQELLISFLHHAGLFF
jgi:hypothetical protein